MRLSPEQRAAAKIEKHIRIGTGEGALESLISHRLRDELPSEPDHVLTKITGARNFWLSEGQRHAGRKLYEDTPGIVGFDLASIGQRGSLAIVELPDNEDPECRTTRYLDTSHEVFRGLGEEEFCVRAVATASQFYLSLAKQVRGANSVIHGAPANGNQPHIETPVQPQQASRGLVVPAPGIAIQPA